MDRPAKESMEVDGCAESAVWRLALCCCRWDDQGDGAGVAAVAPPGWAESGGGYPTTAALLEGES